MPPRGRPQGLPQSLKNIFQECVHGTASAANMLNACMYSMHVHNASTHVPMYTCTHVQYCTEKKFACRVLKAEQSLKAEQKSVARPL